MNLFNKINTQLIGEIMLVRSFEQGRTFAGRLDFKSDLLESINKICLEHNIKSGFVNLIGAVSTLKLGYFMQDTQKYVYLDEISDNHPLEICNCSGNISLKEGKPFAHLHVVASGKNGKCFGGHLMPGTTIYAAEFYIQELLGEDFVRELDQETKLPLWRK